MILRHFESGAYEVRPEWLVAVEQEASGGAVGEREELNVERLARALAKDFGPSYFPGLEDVTIIGTSPLDVAEKIAAEYARLSVNEGGPVEDEVDRLILERSAEENAGKDLRTISERVNEGGPVEPQEPR